MTDEVLDVVSGVVSRAAWAMLLMMVAVECLLPQRALGQNAVPDATQTAEGLQQRVGELEGEVAELKRMVKELQTNSQQSNRFSGHSERAGNLKRGPACGNVRHSLHRTKPIWLSCAIPPSTLGWMDITSTTSMLPSAE